MYKSFNLMHTINNQLASDAKKIKSDNSTVEDLDPKAPDDSDIIEDNEEEDVLTEEQDAAMDDYKMEFLEMTVAAIKNIAMKAEVIMAHMDDARIKENLTEPWLQGIIAVIEDNMTTVHDFVMFSQEMDDTSSGGASKPGLWENIRKKKEREGKKYRPAKPGDDDRPDPKTWKKLTK